MSPDIKKTMEANDKGMRTEYDFTGGTRGKHHRAMEAGYSVTVQQADGTSVTKEVVPTDGAVILEPDLRAYFPDSECHPSADAEFLLSMAGTVETDEQDTSEHVHEIVRASVEKKIGFC